MKQVNLAAPKLQQMLIYMVNTYIDEKYGITGDFETIKEDIITATGMSEAYFESIQEELDFGDATQENRIAAPDGNAEDGSDVTTTIYFTTKDGPDATQFDTHNWPELLGLFHDLLVESKLELVSVDGVEQKIVLAACEKGERKNEC